MYTRYDEKRDELREDLDGCLEKARELLDQSISGYHDMHKDYALKVYQAIKKAQEII